MMAIATRPSGGVARERDRGGHQESGAGEDHRANGAADAREVGVLADPAHQRNDEKRGSDQRDQAGESAGESGGEVTDAHQIQAVGAGAGAARDDRGVELAIGQDVARDYEILAHDGQRRHAAEGSDHGFEQQQVQQEEVHAGSFHSRPTTTAMPITGRGPSPNFHTAANAPSVITRARKALARLLKCGFTRYQMLDHIMAATAAMVPPTPAITHALVRQVS